VNPFDFRGPQFLVFYLALAVIVNWMLRSIFQARENGVPPKLDTVDPYQIAYLRGGANEALRVSVMSLVDRGLLKDVGTELKTVKHVALDIAKRPIEKAILKKFSTQSSAISIFSDTSLKSVCDEYKLRLSNLGLISNWKVQGQRFPPFFIGIVLLSITAGYKLFLAISRGKTNFELLFLFWAVSCYFLVKAYSKPRTALGDQVLSDLRALFARLRSRASFIKKGGATNEVALLAAVFGLSILPESKFPFLKTMFPKASNTLSTSGTSCGASCGSSCGGGGSGCGGCGGD
jgi:uncharacterized protein (TIGR04222 family)